MMPHYNYYNSKQQLNALYKYYMPSSSVLFSLHHDFVHNNVQYSNRFTLELYLRLKTCNHDDGQDKHSISDETVKIDNMHIITLIN